jgi:hypothetical protein
MAGQARVEESENAKLKVHFHEVPRSIKLAAFTAGGGARYRLLPPAS